MGQLIHLCITSPSSSSLTMMILFSSTAVIKSLLLPPKETLHALHGTVILSPAASSRIITTRTNICINVQFLRAVVNIYEKKVIKKEVLDKAVLVKSFFICNDQILDLETLQVYRPYKCLHRLHVRPSIYSN